MDKKYFRVDAAAAYLGFSKWYLYKLTAKKSIAHRKIGSVISFKKEELDTWMDKFKVETQEVSNDK